MGFDPKYLAPTVYDAYKQGPIAWVFVIRTAIELKITNTNKLTDIAFYLHHPELNGEPLGLGDTELIEQWTGFNKLIKIMLLAFSKSIVAPRTSGDDSDRGKWINLLSVSANLSLPMYP